MELLATNVGVDTELFTPGYSVVSVGFALSPSESLVVQRAMGADAEEGEALALVLSPSQECVYEPFVGVELTRGGLSLRLTEEAARTFGEEFISVLFSVPDSRFSEIAQALGTIFSGRRFYVCNERVA